MTAAWPDDRIQELFGIELPILQAPMAGAVLADMAVAVAEAGGLGALPAALLDAEGFRRELGIIRQREQRLRGWDLFKAGQLALELDETRLALRLLERAAGDRTTRKEDKVKAALSQARAAAAAAGGSTGVSSSTIDAGDDPQDRPTRTSTANQPFSSCSVAVRSTRSQRWHTWMIVPGSAATQDLTRICGGIGDGSVAYSRNALRSSADSGCRSSTLTKMVMRASSATIGSSTFLTRASSATAAWPSCSGWTSDSTAGCNFSRFAAVHTGQSWPGCSRSHGHDDDFGASALTSFRYGCDGFSACCRRFLKVLISPSSCAPPVSYAFFASLASSFFRL